jgi:hypothetical protein
MHKELVRDKGAGQPKKKLEHSQVDGGQDWMTAWEPTGEDSIPQLGWEGKGWQERS